MSTPASPSPAAPPVALLGAGLLGSQMALRLLEQGHAVRVWNRSPQKLEALVAAGATAAATPAEAVAGAGRVHLVLAEDDAVDAVFAALLPALGAGVPVYDHSTNLPARVAARRAAHPGVVYRPAPVFMSPADCRKGTGLMLIEGDEASVAASTPALQPMTGRLWPVGDLPGRAAALKLCGNATLLSFAALGGDLLAVAGGAGLGLPDLQELFQNFQIGGALPIFLQRIQRAGAGPASFELSMARKDLRLMIETAGEGPLTVLPAVAGAMDAAIDRGLGAEDFAIFAKRG